MLLGCHWRFAWQDDPEHCPASGLAFQIDLSTEAISHDIMDDVQTQACAPSATPRCKERIECLTLDFRGHSAAVIRKHYFDAVRAQRAR